MSQLEQYLLGKFNRVLLLAKRIRRCVVITIIVFPDDTVQFFIGSPEGQTKNN